MTSLPKVSQANDRNKGAQPPSHRAKVEALCDESDKIIRDVEIYRKISDSRKDALKVLNPALAKEAERDEAIENLTARLEKFEKMFGDSLSNIENLLAKSEKRKE
jgi:hypothetical protein